MKIRKNINLDKFIKNFNKKNKDYYLINHLIEVDNNNNKIILRLPIPINGNENNLKKYDMVSIDMEKILYTLKYSVKDFDHFIKNN